MSTKTWTSDGFGEEEPFSTMEEGEEGPVFTSDAIGEEDPTRPWSEEPAYSTDAIGEEGDPEPAFDTATVRNPFGAF
jgi:hypothetical protein